MGGKVEETGHFCPEEEGTIGGHQLFQVIKRVILQKKRNTIVRCFSQLLVHAGIQQILLCLSVSVVLEGFTSLFR